MRFLVEAAITVDAVVVHTEKEALILENTLIKEHQPKYNVRLVDGSNFLHLRIDTGSSWPRYSLTRNIARDTKKRSVRYFGPFPSASAARSTLEFINRRFPLRTCSDRELASRKRPCLLYQMNRCAGPCVTACSSEEYNRHVDDSVMFLQGRSTALIDRLRDRMEHLSEAEAFEEAALVRDQLQSIQATIERQHVVDRKLRDRDVWGLHREGEHGLVARIPVREGLMHEPTVMRFHGVVDDDGTLLSSLMNRWYELSTSIPPQVLLPVEPADIAGLAELLTDRRGSNVRLITPQRGEGKRLVALATANAKSAWTRSHSQTERLNQTLKTLQRVCRLPRLPRRIECFDNSNLAGADPVASMVVFIDGRPKKSLYRKFMIRTVVGSDDYATMREVISRRVRRGLLEDDSGWELPDLLVVDGGKGQLNAARAVLKDLGVKNVPLIGLAKPKTERKKGDRQTPDKIVLPGVKNPLILRNNHPVLHLLQRIRDESHDTAVRYHRRRRRSRQLHSALEDLAGVGPARRVTLLRHFGGMAAIRAAKFSEIAALPGFGPRLARVIRDNLGGVEE